jgi:nucleotide-binding universal stress UspA family protein
MILPKIEIKKILFATDLSENARLALAYAVSMANLRGIGITIVHALEESPGLVKSGNPVDVIIEAAEKTGCDILVMGTQGHGGLAQMMMGSTARKVLRQSRIPVLVVPLPGR